MAICVSSSEVLAKLVETETRPEEGAIKENHMLFSGLAVHQQEPSGSFDSAEAIELSPVISGASTVIGMASQSKSPEFKGEIAWTELAQNKPKPKTTTMMLENFKVDFN